MLHWLTYGDRMSTNNRDRGVSKSPFSSKRFLQYFHVADTFIDLEVFSKGGKLFRLLLMNFGRIKHLVCTYAF